MINQLIHALSNINENLHPEELLDTLWLADKLNLASTNHVKGQKLDDQSFDETEIKDTSSNFQNSKTNKRIASSDNSKAKSSDDNPPIKKRSIYVKTKQFESTKSNVNTIRVLSSYFIPDKLSIIRALRPLKRYVQSKKEFIFDEEATVEKIAEEKLWLPALKGIPKQQFSLYLIIDYSPSMVIWQPFILELKQLFEQMGLFLFVKSWWMMNDHGKIQFLSSLGKSWHPSYPLKTS